MPHQLYMPQTRRTTLVRAVEEFDTNSQANTQRSVPFSYLEALRAELAHSNESGASDAAALLAKQHAALSQKIKRHEIQIISDALRDTPPAYMHAVLGAVRHIATLPDHAGTIEDDVRADACRSLKRHACDAESKRDAVALMLHDLRQTHSPQPNTVKALASWLWGNNPNHEAELHREMATGILAAARQLPLGQQIGALRTLISVVGERRADAPPALGDVLNEIAEYVTEQVPKLASHSDAAAATKLWADLLQNVIVFKNASHLWTNLARDKTAQAIAQFPNPLREKLEFYFVGNYDDRKARSVVNRVVTDTLAGVSGKPYAPKILRRVSATISASTFSNLLRVYNQADEAGRARWLSEMRRSLRSVGPDGSPVLEKKRAQKLSYLMDRNFPNEVPDYVKRFSVPPECIHSDFGWARYVSTGLLWRSDVTAFDGFM